MPPDVYNYLDNNTVIFVNVMPFFLKLNQLVKETKPEIITNFILWRYMQNIKLDKRFNTIKQVIYN